MNLEKEIIKKFTFIEQDIEKPQIWIIKIDGKTIFTRSCKNQWAKKQHAASALKLEIKRNLEEIFYKDLHVWRISGKVNEWMKENYLNWKKEHVNFVRIY